MTRLAVVLLLTAGLGAAEPTQDEARDALRRAIAFFHHEVAIEGGYLWRYSADLSKREGEGKVEREAVWVQPPATPSVGEAYLDAFEATGEASALAAARDAGAVLIRGQLHSGGWQDRVLLDRDERGTQAYRVDGPPGKKARNYSSLDDDKTQSALRFLMRLDQATGFDDPHLGGAVTYALRALEGAQFPNGGWTQVYEGPADPDAPVLAASFPAGEPTHDKQYWFHYTLNDDTQADAIATMLLAHQIYGDQRWLASALHGGDFLIAAQLPEPQPAWAQQYDRQMQPAWARKFEPAAVSGGESQEVLRTLMDLYQATGERRFLEPIPAALAWFERSRLPDGRLARFYELETNRPLYMTSDYQLTYDDDDLPTHYGFQVTDKSAKLAKRYHELIDDPWSPPQPRTPQRPDPDEVRAVIDALDERGAWVEDGELRFHGKGDDTTRIIDPETFADNLRVLAGFARN